MKQYQNIAEISWSQMDQFRDLLTCSEHRAPPMMLLAGGGGGGGLKMNLNCQMLCVNKMSIFGVLLDHLRKVFTRFKIKLTLFLIMTSWNCHTRE